MTIWFSLPRVPETPNDPGALLHWLGEFRREVERVLTEIQITGTTRALACWRGEQTVATGFSIDPNAPVIALNATFAATSSETEAVKDGPDNASQFLVLLNTSTNTVTLRHGANLSLAYATHVTLDQNEALFLEWSGSQWVEVA